MLYFKQFKAPSLGFTHTLIDEILSIILYLPNKRVALIVEDPLQREQQELMLQ